MTIEIAYTSTDSYFGAPWFDVDEWRETPRRHRFVHGGFAGTDARFSFYFPPEEVYRDRFFTSVEGGPGGHESRAAALGEGGGLASIGFAFSHGAVLSESNGGHIGPPGAFAGRGSVDGSVTTWRATAESTRLARALATQIYGRPPAHGYIFGPSGGGWRTILCIENTRGIWDGAVPYISPAGHGASFPAIISNLVRVLGEDLPSVVAAWEPGGSGDPFEHLNSEQRATLATAYKAGLQPGAEGQLLSPVPELVVLLTTSEMHRDYDPAYFEAFWAERGYRGGDGELADELIEAEVQITAGVTKAQVGGALGDVLPNAGLIADDAVVGLRLATGIAPRRLRGCDVTLEGGVRLTCLGWVGDVLILDRRAPERLAAITPGMTAKLSNRHYLAYCHAFRHQVDRGAPECGQFMADGLPIYPQRSLDVSDVLAGAHATGAFEAKVIYFCNRLDTLASPLGGPVSWAGKVRRALGERAGDQFRVWLNDNGGHIAPASRPPGPAPVVDTRIVDTLGCAESAMGDMIAWVERGVAPPADTDFTVEDGRIRLAAPAKARLGIQPLVAATAKGATCATARVGEPVAFEVQADIPPGGGELIGVEWDFDGLGAWPICHERSAGGVELSASHTYAEPGVYFPCVRVTTHRDPGGPTAYGRVRNLARIRVEVT